MLNGLNFQGTHVNLMNPASSTTPPAPASLVEQQQRAPSEPPLGLTQNAGASSDDEAQELPRKLSPTAAIAGETSKVRFHSMITASWLHHAGWPFTQIIGFKPRHLDLLLKVHEADEKVINALKKCDTERPERTSDDTAIDSFFVGLSGTASTTYSIRGFMDKNSFRDVLKHDVLKEITKIDLNDALEQLNIVDATFKEEEKRIQNVQKVATTSTSGSPPKVNPSVEKWEEAAKILLQKLMEKTDDDPLTLTWKNVDDNALKNDGYVLQSAAKKRGIRTEKNDPVFVKGKPTTFIKGKPTFGPKQLMTREDLIRILNRPDNNDALA
jgi:hypothetical protein